MNRSGRASVKGVNFIDIEDVASDLQPCDFSNLRQERLGDVGGNGDERPVLGQDSGCDSRSTSSCLSDETGTEDVVIQAEPARVVLEDEDHLPATPHYFCRVWL